MEHHADVSAVCGHEEIGGDAAYGREEDQKDGDIKAGFAGEKDEGKRPEEIELLFEAEGPEVGENHGSRVEVVIPEVEGTADKAVEVDGFNVQEAAKSHDGKEGIERRENPEGATDIEVAQADFACFRVLLEQEVGDEVPADDEEDGYAQMAIAQREHEVIGAPSP